MVHNFKKKKKIVPEKKFVTIKRPRGRSKKDKFWDYKKGKWIKMDKIIITRTNYIILDKTNTGSGFMKIKLLVNLKNKVIISIDEIKRDTNSNYIFIKYINKDIKNHYIDNMIKMKHYSNRLIYYPIDFKWKVSEKEYIQFFVDISSKFNTIIFNSYFHKKMFSNFNLKCKCLVGYHEYDDNYKITNRVNEIQYIGLSKKSSFQKNDYKKYNISLIEQNYYENVKTCIHIDFLLGDTLYYKIHTSTKLGTALVTNSIFICNRIPIYQEILGNDYDLFINDDLSNINDIITKARKILLNDNLYAKYLEKMKIAKELLKPKNISEQLIRLCNL